MILITGATGQLGAAVVQQLLARTPAAQVAVLARDAGRADGLRQRGVSVRQGDYNDPTSLGQAMEGVDRVLLVASNDLEARVQQHENVINAAVTAGVELLGFTSRSLVDIEASQNPMMADYFQTEELITASGLPALIFRNALYLDTLPYSLGPSVFETGMRVPAGDGRVAYALRREMGEATANAMLDHHGPSRTYVLSAPRAYSFSDIAAGLGEIGGEVVTYTPVSDDEFISASVRGGAPEPMARRLAGFFADIRDNQLSETSRDLETLLGRPPASLAEGLAELFSR